MLIHCAGKTVKSLEKQHVPYLSASAMVFQCEEALYQVYAPLPLLVPLPFTFTRVTRRICSFESNGTSVITEICQEILTLMSRLSVTQGHRNRHGSISYL